MAEAIKKRSEIEAKYKWDLTHIYKTDEAWEEEFQKVLADVDSISAYDGHVAENPKAAIRAMQALNDREREVLLFRIIDDMDWGQTVSQMNGLHNNSYSKRTLQRLLDRAMEKAYEVVK